MKNILTVIFAVWSAYATADEVNIQLRFTIETPRGPYSDALYFTPSEWDKRDDAAIEAEKNRRADNWLATLNASPRVETKEEKQIRAYALDAEITDLATQKAQVLDEIGRMP